MPRKKSRCGLRKVDLPVEVWAKIAAHMSLRHWALASGTCRSTRAVRLKNLSFRCAVARSMGWAGRMLDEAEALCLPTRVLQEYAQGVADGMYGIKHLQQLIVDAQPLTESALSCLPWLLAQTSGLEVLDTPAGSSPWIPPMASLKHLTLRFEYDTGNFDKAVLSLTGLETLYLLNCAKFGRRHASVNVLDMRALPHLRVFKMKGIRLHGIKIPKACQLHIDCFCAGTDMQKSIWKRALANIHGIDVRLDAATLDLFLARTVSPLGNLRVVNIYLYHAQPVPDEFIFDLRGFAGVKNLRISGKDLTLRLPVGVCWDSVELSAKNKLVLKFEDLNGFPLAVKCFSATFGNLRSTQVLELCTALSAHGIECTFQEEERGKSMVWFPAGQRLPKCCCGACLDCLVASGQAVAHVTEDNSPGLLPDPLYDDVRYYGGMTDEEDDMNYDVAEDDSTITSDYSSEDSSSDSDVEADEHNSDDGW